MKRTVPCFFCGEQAKRQVFLQSQELITAQPCDPPNLAKHFFAVSKDGPDANDLDKYVQPPTPFGRSSEFFKNAPAQAVCPDHVEDLRNLYRYDLLIEITYEEWVIFHVMAA